jgi:hypothetical protein
VPIALARVEKKLREAAFFLRAVHAAGDMDGGSPEIFDFYLSAFLSAAKSVEDMLRQDRQAKYDSWRDTWISKLASPERALMRFIAVDRNQEVHRRGSRRVQRDKQVKLAAGTTYPDGSTMVAGPPGMMDAATIIRPDYYFTIDSAEMRVGDACARHVALLERLVGDFRVEHP